MSGKTGLLTVRSDVRNEPKYSIRGRTDGRNPERRGDKSPAPGEYGALANMPEKTKFARSTSAGFGTSIRLGPSGGMTHSKSCPGPGAYNPKGRSNDFHNVSCGFGSSIRKGMGLKKNTPGPATYDIRGNIEGTCMSFAARYKRPDPPTIPGPGAYGAPKVDVFTYEAAPKFGFGTSVRPPINGMDNRVPGPGQYGAPTKLHATAPQFSMKPRREALEMKGNANPGPGMAFTCIA